MDQINKIVVEFDGPFEVGEGKQQVVASLPQMKGMVCAGETKEEAFEELMISLKVKLAYDNGIDIRVKKQNSGSSL